MKVAPKIPLKRGAKGFALVITVSLMVLLTLIVVGLLTLSAVTLRAASHGDAAAVARNNARLGMMLALGELQTGMGPDRRVSATAASVNSSVASPHLTGVWETPKGGPPSGNPGNYYSQKANQFRGWLVSTTTPERAADRTLPSSEPEDSIELVADYEKDRESTVVRAQKVPVTLEKGRGHYAYAVFDESAKAAIDLGDPQIVPQGGLEVASRTVPSRMRADVAAPLEALEKPENLISLETAIIPGGQSTAEDVRQRFHDFTTASVGLLTDTASGGLRTDLTSLFEGTSLSANAFPSPTLYGSTNTGGPRWEYIFDHYRKFRNLTGVATGSPQYSPTSADLAVSRTQGLDTSPTTERLLPVIAKFQLIFSIVSHHAHISDRVSFLNSQGDPQGNNQHAVPHLAYDPVITLYNPYDVALNLRNMRIRVWDPPIGFRVAKRDNRTNSQVWYRPEMASEFHGLARFQIANERNPSARRTFTLLLSDGSAARAGTTLRLQPGEVKVFSPRVEQNWTWAFETGSAYDPRSFFDWNAGLDFGNIDKRTNQRLGVESVPGWDIRAGFQVDHLSYGGRPPETLYSFEGPPQKGGVGGFVSLRLTDDVIVEARPQRNTANVQDATADFQVDVLAGRVEDVRSDIVRSYRFNFGSPDSSGALLELSQFPQSPVIRRRLNTGQTLQAPNDRSAGGKTPFAMLEMSARTPRDPLIDTKPWLFNNPVTEGALANTRNAGLAVQSYDVRVLEVQSFQNLVDIDANNRGFFGASKTAQEGSSNVPMHRVAQAPAASLGDLIPANLVAGSSLPRVMHPLGNSRAHPLIAAQNVIAGSGANTLLDHSYLLNNTLWDKYFFSSITTYEQGAQSDTDGRNRRAVLRDVLAGTRPALNTRLVPATSPGDPDTLADEIEGLGDLERARTIASHLAVSGPFNLNSTSVDAWRAVLSSLRDRAVTVWSHRSTNNQDLVPFARMGLPLAGSAEGGGEAGFDVAGQIRWAGFRALDDSKIEALAEEIVKQIQLRGEQDGAPALTIGEFVNRRPGNGLHAQAGILQTAIDEAGVNAAFHELDSRSVNGASITNLRRAGVSNLAALDGFSGEGAPPMLTQGDLMMGLAAIATVRGDTFKIRSYGEATAADGTILARAWCEAIVQRIPEYVDPADAPDVAEDDLDSDVNELFGRRFQVVAFRWLNEDEIYSNEA